MAKLGRSTNRVELQLFNPENPRSLVFLVPQELAIRIRALWNSEYKFLLGLPEKQLIKELNQAGFFPGARDYKMRFAFWIEYERSLALPSVKTKIDMAYVYGFLMARETFYSNYIGKLHHIAFLLSPPEDFADSVKVALNHTHEAILATIQKLSSKAELSPPELKFLQTTYDKFMTLSGLAPMPQGKSGGKVLDEEPEETSEPGESVPIEGSVQEELEALSKLADQVEI